LNDRAIELRECDPHSVIFVFNSSSLTSRPRPERCQRSLIDNVLNSLIWPQFMFHDDKRLNFELIAVSGKIALVTQNQINHNAKMGRMEQSLPQVGKNTH